MKGSFGQILPLSCWILVILGLHLTRIVHRCEIDGQGNLNGDVSTILRNGGYGHVLFTSKLGV